MAKKTLYTLCPSCKGTKEVWQSEYVPPNEGGNSGLDQMVSRPCATCEATGYVVSGRLDDNLIDLLQTIKDKVNEIKEKVDTL